MKRWVVDFKDGSRDMRELLGGKGANVAEMTRVLGAERVPAGFTITTEACVATMRDGAFPTGMLDEVRAALDRLETQAGKVLGAAGDPLLVSVRSGARESMPGMLDTVLNLGLNDESVLGLAAATANERFAWDSYRRFVQMFGNVVHGIPGEAFEAELSSARRDAGVATDSELDAAALQALVARFQSIFEDHTGQAFPADPHAQLEQAIQAVFDSWTGERAVVYRRINHIPDDWGTAVNVQQMVFGNKGDTSGSGVAFSRDEVTGEPEPSGDFLANAQGEDVVSGVRNTQDIAELADVAARGARAADGHPADARAPLRRHAGLRVHRGGGAPVHAADAQRQAPGAGGGALRRRRRGGGPARQGAGDRDDRRRQARRAAAPDVRPGRAVHRAARGASPRPRARPRARSSSPRRRRWRRRPRGRT